jgi:hypothetical protein
VRKGFNGLGLGSYVVDWCANKLSFARPALSTAGLRFEKRHVMRLLRVAGFHSDRNQANP